jgi:ATP-dependent RNA circularization protein (DNA/RNA ligase family)
MLFRQEGERLMKILEHCVLKNLRVKKKMKSFLFSKRTRRMLCQTLCGKGLMPLVIRKFPKTQRCLLIKGRWRLRKNFAPVLLICLPPLNR